MDDLLDFDWKQPMGSSQPQRPPTGADANRNRNGNRNGKATLAHLSAQQQQAAATTAATPAPNTSRPHALSAFDFDLFEQPASRSSKTATPVDPFDAFDNARPSKPVTPVDPFDAFDNPQPASAAGASTGNTLDLFDSPSRPTHPAAHPATASDPFDDPEAFAAAGTRNRTRNRNNDATATDDDDILGALAKPVEQQQRQTRDSLHPSRRPAERLGTAASSATATSASSSPYSSRQPSPADGSRPRQRTQPPPPPPPRRAVSPPPHILGQIVEMGFSPKQARQALARTESGLDVEAALELLVGGGGGGQAESNGRRFADDERLAEDLQRHEAEAAAGYRDGVGDDDDDDDDDAAMAAYEAREAERRRRRRAGPTRQGADEAARSTHPRGATPSGHQQQQQQAGNSTEWQQQADQLYAQASEIGANVLGRASALWSSAKAQAQRALEEHQKVASSSSHDAGSTSTSAVEAERGSSPAAAGGSERARARRWGLGAVGGGAAGVGAARKEWEGKPRWMVEAEANEAAAAAGELEAASASAAEGGAFKDSDDEGETGGAAAPPAIPRRPNQQGGRRGAPAAEVPTTTVNLWDDQGEAAGLGTPPAAAAAKQRPNQQGLSAPGATDGGRRPYVSPNRRGPARSPAPRTTSDSAAAAAPAPKMQRTISPDAPSAVTTSREHREAGNAHFKRGAYGDAESCYTRGIDVLSSTSLRLVPLLNNRANARLKNGSAPGAVEDCERVLSLISPRGIYRPSREEALPPDLAGEVNLRDAYAKALLRRGQGLEAMEKWERAEETWSLLVAYEKEEGSGPAGGGVNNLRFAKDGVARCGKMLGRRVSPTSSSTTTSTASMPIRRRPATTSTTTPTSGSATAAYKAHQATLASEETERLSLKDSVDARLSAWRSGKESNLRALLASVESVAWEGLGWKKMGMHELVTDSQVKKAYVRGIGRVHPDKLKNDSTTTEQRMLAAGIFNALNEAWNASLGR